MRLFFIFFLPIIIVFLAQTRLCYTKNAHYTNPQHFFKNNFKNNIKNINWSLAIGEKLFHEKRLSRNGTRACASCHAPEMAFTDGYRRSLGIEADLHLHNAPSLLNAAAMKNLTWSDSTIHTFRAQMQQPFFGNKPMEMGLNYSDTALIINILQKDRSYSNLFAQAKKNISWYNIENSISDYLFSLKSDTTQKIIHNAAENEAIAAGKTVFFAAKTKCAACHPPPYYTLAASSNQAYFNIGLHQKYPKTDNGLRQTTHKTADDGKFRVPSLLNVGKTAPYMHDGSLANLSDVLTIFENGGAEKGKKNPQKSKLLTGFRLSSKEKRDLLAFLYSL